MNRRYSIILAVMIQCIARFVQADDHGNSPTNATWIPPGSTGTMAQFETDIDQDWFRFTAAPSLIYTIQVNNITLWDNAFSIKAFADGDKLRSTNSAFAANSSRIIWTNIGGARSYYIGVSALFEFATGTYSVVISTNDYDSDGDGMADAWEITQFGSLTNGAIGDADLDGAPNYDEYVAGTVPVNSNSLLVVTDLWRISGNSAISWPAVSYGIYRVEATTNLLNSGGWTYQSRVFRLAAAGSEQFIDTAGTNSWRHYRVIYEQ